MQLLSCCYTDENNPVYGSDFNCDVIDSKTHGGAGGDSGDNYHSVF